MTTATKHNCDLCGEDNPLLLEMVPGAAVCGNCGFVYVPFRRSPEAIAKAWDDVWGEGYTSAWPMVKARLTYVAEWIDQNIGLAGKSVLDIGAGEGEFMALASIRDAALVFGIEPSAANVEKIREDYMRVHLGTIEDCKLSPYGLDKFDIVTVLWTLENCGDCIDFLKRAKSFLKPDGYLVVATGSRILVPFKKPLSSYVGNNPPDLHCFRFSVNTLSIAMDKAGIESGAVNYYAEGDWLVMAGSPRDGEFPVVEYDDPERVLQFFKSWQEMFP